MVDLATHTIGLDVWEGQLDIDEPQLWNGGVRYLIPRLNDMNGGHHRDEYFDIQWYQAEYFVRFPYFVYNPWVSGKLNYEWFADNAPQNIKLFSCDVEVAKSGYPPADYGRELAAFIALASQYWRVMIYTGAWFLPLVTPWPTNVYYWYARYPYVVYPAERENWSFEKLKSVLGGMSWTPGSSAPGEVKFWQCSGDRILLPGTLRAIDINLFKGSYADLCAFTGQNPRPEPTLETRVKALEARVTKLEQGLILGEPR